MVVCAACSSLPPEPAIVAPPLGRDAVRALAIVVEPVPAAVRIEKPPVGPLQGLIAGAKQGGAAAGQFAQFTGNSGAPPMGMLVWGFITATAFTVCVVGSAFHGTVAAGTAAEAAHQLQAVQHAFAESPPDLGLSAAFPLAVAAVRPGLRLVATGEPADATLTVRVVGLGLLGQPGVDPAVCVVALIETEWVAGELRHRAEFQYRSPVAPLSVWSGDPPRIGAELVFAGKQLADTIAEQLLLVEVRR